jgi:hypothetical protein
MAAAFLSPEALYQEGFSSIFLIFTLKIRSVQPARAVVLKRVD